MVVHREPPEYFGAGEIEMAEGDVAPIVECASRAGTGFGETVSIETGRSGFLRLVTEFAQDYRKRFLCHEHISFVLTARISRLSAVRPEVSLYR
jgi:hypothetical protein